MHCKSQRSGKNFNKWENPTYTASCNFNVGPLFRIETITGSLPWKLACVFQWAALSPTCHPVGFQSAQQLCQHGSQCQLRIRFGLLTVEHFVWLCQEKHSLFKSLRPPCFICTREIQSGHQSSTPKWTLIWACVLTMRGSVEQPLQGFWVERRLSGFLSPHVPLAEHRFFWWLPMHGTWP